MWRESNEHLREDDMEWLWNVTGGPILEIVIVSGQFVQSAVIDATVNVVNYGGEVAGVINGIFKGGSV